MENHEQKPTPEPRKNVSMDGVLDELRSVLSDLGNSSAPSPLPPEEPSLPPPPLMAPPSAPPEPAPPPSNDVASDADFWKGNVLGWPSDAGMQSPPPPAPPPPPEPRPLSYEKPALEGGPFSLDTPFLNAAPFLDSQVGIGNPAGGAPLIPEPPSPPASPPLPPAEAPPTGFSPQGPFAGTEPAIPIPGTFTEDSKPAAPPAKADDPLNLNKSELKPAGLVQIACFFPEGQERQGQQFVGKLRESSEKSRFRLKIEPVFVSGWSNGQADVATWTKSATLSGADIMFILAPKKDIEQFKTSFANPLQGGPRVRFIALEQIALRTLYADILIELGRGR